ncbi:hypothetical protein J437_LFUL008694 [Ladona fulva]|uniref:Cytochrome P450 n=1 Tax=Ladona fulva TaxID=123851 RepID=A0A8K0K7L1_LADFU|nr:hypothetical protein J437_LFUL008694 [Ladona fulva]
MARFIPYYRRTIQYLVEGKNQTHELYKEFILEHIAKREISLREKTEGDVDVCFKEAEVRHRSEGEERPHDAIDAYLIDANRRDRKGDEPTNSRELASDTQVHHVLADLFGAGLDTTMATLRWFLLMLAVNPRAQDLVQEELDNLLGAPGHEKRLVTLEDAIHLPYTEAAIAEAQRIRPVVPLGIPHGALKDTSLGGYRIPKGTMLIALQWVLHNGEVPWGKDAEKIFDPTRFIDSDGNFSSRQKEHFMPFQTGRRVCVGEDLAHMFLFLFGVSIFHEFRLSLPPGADADDILEGDSGITLTPKHHTLIFKRRFIH